MHAEGTRLFDTTGFVPRWNCGVWSHGLGWVHIVSDLVTFAAYFLIPATIAYFAFQRRDIQFRSIYILFGLFILSCGTVHLVEAIIFWAPIYRFSAFVKSITAVISVASLVALFFVAPKALRLPGYKALYEEIRVNENRYRSLVRATNAVVWTADKNGELVTVQNSWNAYTGQSFDKSKGFGWLDRIHQDDQKRVQESWEQACATGDQYFVEGRIWSEEHHSYRHFEARAVPIKDTSSEIVEWVGAIRDTEDEKLLEIDKIDANELASVALESVTCGLVIANQNGIIKRVNSQLTDMLGYNADEIVGQTIEKLVPTKSRETHTKSRNLFFESPSKRAIGQNRDLVALASSGKEIPVEVGLNPLQYRGELHAVATIVDIAERKRTEAALRGYANQLKIANEDLDQFVHAASHDLKEPIRGISTYCGFILEDHAEQMNAELRDMVKKIETLAHRTHNMISGILNFRRLHEQLENSPACELREIIAIAKETLIAQLSHEQVLFKIQPHLPVVMGAKTELVSVFQNLISNGIKYNNNEEKVIEVGCKSSEDGKEALIWLRDNGMGIDKKHTGNLFKLFKRLPNARGKEEGTGVGLAFAKRIIERHGGTIWLESQVNEGTTFFFTLPLAAPA
ncbi:MAG: PAS domain S-box protein [Myxococcales bacterium]|nr:MAG: PAS domain S-box protein [Myxococcales bacterium]